VLSRDITVGHALGEEKLEEFLEWCLDLDIKYITVFAFSTENFNRGDEEIDYLMDLFEASLYKIAGLERTHEKRLRVRVMGDREALSDDMRAAIDHAESRTAGYSDYNFTIAMAYGGRQEIITAVRDIARKVRDGEMEVGDISEETFSRHLYTSDMPDPDLILRTSGEVRLSNFLLWQIAYSELYFTDVYWPGFRYIDLLRAIRSYQMRIRRYGG
jgi:tritrans,polycis-undecaprenyl-diphosphate synthase [geranylgeranyl-diphosphate specific]